MKSFQNKLAVITGGGDGIGREIARQLASQGCHIAICDILADNMTQTKQLCDSQAPEGTVISTHICDVSNEKQVIEFKDAVLNEHNTQHINLLFNNAGVSAGGSFILNERSDWDRTFNILWYGVYYCTRAFIQPLIASNEGHIINISSMGGFWACQSPESPNTAYCSAKFAVKGFSEALLVDLRLNAPHVNISVVMPGHVGTSLAANSAIALGHFDADKMTAAQLQNFRHRMQLRGHPITEMSDDQLRVEIQNRLDAFREFALTTAEQAASIIIDGVAHNRWRILVGDDAKCIDHLVREDPENAYEQSFMEKLQAKGYNVGQFDPFFLELL